MYDVSLRSEDVRNRSFCVYARMQYMLCREGMESGMLESRIELSSVGSREYMCLPSDFVALRNGNICAHIYSGENICAHIYSARAEM